MSARGWLCALLGIESPGERIGRSLTENVGAGFAAGLNPPPPTVSRERVEALLRATREERRAIEAARWRRLTEALAEEVRAAVLCDCAATVRPEAGGVGFVCSACGGAVRPLDQ